MGRDRPCAQEIGKYMDEVLVAIAFNLGRCVEFIGPVRPLPEPALPADRSGSRTRWLLPAAPRQMSEIPCLLKPLEFLCNIEETTVRDEAVASLNLICKGMEPEQARAPPLR